MSKQLSSLIKALPNIFPIKLGLLLGVVGAYCFNQQSVASAQPVIEIAPDGVASRDVSPDQQEDHRSANAVSVQGGRQAMGESDAASPDVKVHAAAHTGFSRLVFAWPWPIGHEIMQRGDYIVVTFDRPVSMDVSSLVGAAGGRLVGAMVEEGGRRVLMMTQGDLDLEIRNDESDRLVLDLITSAERPMISPASLDRPNVDVRAGEHAGFSRLVFDWPAPISHDVRQGGDHIVVTFNRPGRMDVSSLVARAGGRLIDATVEDNGRRVLLKTRGALDFQIRDYESDLLVLDLGAAISAPVPMGRALLEDDVKDVAAFDDINTGYSRRRPVVQATLETPPATEPLERPSNGSADVPSAASQAGPGQFDVDEDALDRALERTLTREGVLLLPTGKVEITPSFTYRQRESRAPTQVDLFGLFAQVRETEIRREEFEAGIAVDIGLPFDSQLEISQAYKHIDQTTMTSAGFVGLEESEETADAFDDLVVGLAKGLLREGRWWPDLVGRISWDSDTGDGRDGKIGLGGGNHELTGSLSFVKTRDPLAFFGSVSYRHSFENDGFDPGDQIGVSLGTTLAAGPDTSLRLALSQSFIGKTEVNDTKIPGSKETSASLTAGASLVLGRGVLLDTSVTAGLTDEAPDYSARVALPVRFDPF